jgi:hydroxybutyrate-dimer hydrolase
LRRDAGPYLICIKEAWNAAAYLRRDAVGGARRRLGLLPTAFTSEPYIAWLQREARQPLYWRVPHAQHFDAFLPLPGFGERHGPLLLFGYAALDRLWAHLYQGQPWPREVPTPAATPRGAGALERAMLGLP